MDRHNLKVLNQIREHTAFLESLTTVCDMGCGVGEDIEWWATLENDSYDPPKPYNFKCYAVDRDPIALSKVIDLPNVKKINKDFNDPHIVPVDIDLLWSHDSLQSSINPLQTLRNWNEMMTVDGMLIISVKQQTGIEHNRYYSRTYSGAYYHYNATNLIYMLAVNGFDCRDAYLLKEHNDPWLHVAVYKSRVKPMDYEKTTWQDLMDANLLHPTIEESIKAHGYLAQEFMFLPWLDRSRHFIDWIPQRTEYPPELADIEPEITGVQNTTLPPVSGNSIQQAKPVTTMVELAKPVGILRMPKGKFVKSK